jgi:HNH endonuclease
MSFKDDDYYERNNITFLNDKPCKETTFTPSNKYPTIHVDGKMQRLSRVIWKNHYGPDSLLSHEYILHQCDNTRCIEITHLTLGDNSLNMKDAYTKGRKGKYKLPNDLKSYEIGYLL